MKRRAYLVVILLGVGLTIYFAFRAKVPTLGKPATAPSANAAHSFPPVTPSVGATPAPLPPAQTTNADDITLIDDRDPAHAEALAQIERWFGRYLSEGDFVDRLTNEQLGELVHKLAVARLSQSIYEAKIATVERKPDGTVIISVPAYDRAGAGLADYVARDLLWEMTDVHLHTRVLLQYFGFGHSPQSFTVSLMRDRKGWNDEAIYLIRHDRGSVPPDIPATDISGLAIRQLGQYAPLARFFPEP